MNTDEEKLILDNMNLAYDIAWKYNKKFNNIIPLDELQSLSFLGLTKAAKTFKKELGNNFSTYAYSCITNEILYYYRQNINHINNLSLSEPNNDELTLEDMIASNEDVFEDLSLELDIEFLRQSIKLLKPRHQKVLEYKLKGYTFKKMASIIGVSLTQICNDYNKALNILRYKFKDRKEDL
jgi:RNA polymerase sigma factor (sigma-70 family)